MRKEDEQEREGVKVEHKEGEKRQAELKLMGPAPSSSLSSFFGIKERQAKENKRQPKIVITFGTFDLLHVGHIRLLRRAREMGDWLVVGVSSDELNIQKKHRAPIYSCEERLEMIQSLKYVDEVFVERSLELKSFYIQQYGASVLVMGDDWQGAFDSLASASSFFSSVFQPAPPLEVVYLPRTPSISTTETIEKCVQIQ